MFCCMQSRLRLTFQQCCLGGNFVSCEPHMSPCNLLAFHPAAVFSPLPTAACCSVLCCCCCCTWLRRSSSRLMTPHQERLNPHLLRESQSRSCIRPWPTSTASQGQCQLRRLTSARSLTPVEAARSHHIRQVTHSGGGRQVTSHPPGHSLRWRPP
jgi:hypothetical protein